MSEFSESYHLRAVQPQRGEDLLRSAGANGFVYPQANGWVTVLAEGEPFQFDPRLLPANQGGLFYYWCAEDQGWGFVACWNDGAFSPPNDHAIQYNDPPEERNAYWRP